jgi:glycosyltransferase 2 family protein
MTTSLSRRLSIVFGTLVSLTGLGYVLHLVGKEYAAIEPMLGEADPLLLVGALALTMAAMASIGTVWQRIVMDMHCPLPLATALRAYFLGQLGKYVPGGAFAIIGRSEWAHRAGASRTVAYTSTVISVTSAYFAASLVTSLALVLGARPHGSVYLLVPVLGLAPVGLLLAHQHVRAVLHVHRVPLLTRCLSALPAGSRILKFSLAQVPAWLLLAAATWIIANALGVDLPIANTLLATAVSWTLGFLFLPAPGGIGVREATFVLLLNGDGSVAAVALLARLTCVAADVMGAATSSATCFVIQRCVSCPPAS